VGKELNEEEEKALRDICDVLLPNRLNLSLDDVFSGYDKQKAIDRIIKEAKKQPSISSLKMRTVYTILKRVYEPSSFREEVKKEDVRGLLPRPPVLP